MTRTTVLTALAGLAALTCQLPHAEAAVHRVKLKKRSDEEFVRAKLDKVHDNEKSNRGGEAVVTGDEPK